MIHKLFTLPLKAIIKIGEKVQEEVDKELYDIPYLQQQLIQLHTMYELQEIDSDFYKQKEEELLTRYKLAKERERGISSD